MNNSLKFQIIGVNDLILNIRDTIKSIILYYEEATPEQYDYHLNQEDLDKEIKKYKNFLKDLKKIDLKKCKVKDIDAILGEGYIKLTCVFCDESVSELIRITKHNRDNWDICYKCAKKLYDMTESDIQPEHFGGILPH